MERVSKLVVAGVLLACVALGGIPVQAQKDKELFEDETITFLVPFRTGGGTDRWARFWAPIIAKNLPGYPKFVVKNVTGGGSTKGANAYDNDTAKDGLTLFVSSASVMYPFILGDRRVKYDYRNWKALIVSPTGGVVYSRPEAVDLGGPVLFKDGVKQKLSIQGPTQIGMVMLLALELLEVPNQVAFGASGASETFRNFRHGRVTTDMQTTASYKFNVEKLVEEQKAVPVFSLGAISGDGEIERDPNFPNLPHFIEYYERVKNKPLDGRLADLWKQLFISGFPTQKMLLVHNEVPDEYLQAFDEAIRQTIENPQEWPNDHRAILGEYSQFYGQQAQDLLEQNLNSDLLDIASFYKEWLEETQNIKI